MLKRKQVFQTIFFQNWSYLWHMDAKQLNVAVNVATITIKWVLPLDSPWIITQLIVGSVSFVCNFCDLLSLQLHIGIQHYYFDINNIFKELEGSSWYNIKASTQVLATPTHIYIMWFYMKPYCLCCDICMFICNSPMCSSVRRASLILDLNPVPFDSELNYSRSEMEPMWEPVPK